MIDFHHFETFDPNGPGLGNLFGQISPFEALGIWPSGDFRLAPGDGAVPAVGYYLGAAFGLGAAPLRGRRRCWRRRETAILSGLAAAALAYLAARVGGTAYTAAKAIEIAAPLAALTILLPLLRPRLPRWPGRGALSGRRASPGPAAACLSPRPASAAAGSARRWPRQRPGRADLLLAGPDRPAAAGRRRTRPWSSPRPTCSPTNTARPTSPGSCAAAASASPRTRKRRTSCPHGRPLRRHRRRAAASRRSQACAVRQVAPPYVLWEATGTGRRAEPCPLIAVRQARQGPAR